jgi:hypothetical protein
MVKHQAFVPALLAGLTLVGCAPDLDDRLSLIDGPTFLAVRSEPAEAAPNTAVTYTVLMADAQGARGETVDWAFCNERKPLAILGPVSPLCLEPEGDHLVPLGTGLQVSGTLPQGACRVFGPEPPEGADGEPPRGFDADGTGGYHQPVRVLERTERGELYGIGKTRIRCGIQGATGAQIREFSRRYLANTNPAVERVDRMEGEGATALTADDGTGAATNVVLPGEVVDLRARWAACPDELDELTAGCTGSEPFLHFDVVERELRERHESMSVAWYATAGVLWQDRTGRDEGDRTPHSDNVWEAPLEAGPVHLWVVLRDSRGGVAWQSYRFEVVAP